MLCEIIGQVVFLDRVCVSSQLPDLTDSSESSKTYPFARCALIVTKLWCRGIKGWGGGSTLVTQVVFVSRQDPNPVLSDDELRGSGCSGGAISVHKVNGNVYWLWNFEDSKRSKRSNCCVCLDQVNLYGPNVGLEAWMLQYNLIYTCYMVPIPIQSLQSY